MFSHIDHSFPELIQENLNGSRHYVTPDGKKYPSITTVLSNYKKEGLYEWRKKVGEKEANRISSQSASRGTKFHFVLEKYLGNEPLPDMMPNIKSLFLKAKPVVDRLNNIHCLEKRLVSRELKIAGTVDCVAEFDGQLMVVDFKTSRKYKNHEHIENYFMQGAAYSVMFNEMTGIPVDDVLILIGVEEEPLPQLIQVKPNDYLPQLKSEIHKYYNKF